LSTSCAEPGCGITFPVHAFLHITVNGEPILPCNVTHRHVRDKRFDCYYHKVHVNLIVHRVGVELGEFVVVLYPSTEELVKTNPAYKKIEIEPKSDVKLLDRINPSSGDGTNIVLSFSTPHQRLLQRPVHVHDLNSIAWVNLTKKQPNEDSVYGSPGFFFAHAFPSAAASACPQGDALAATWSSSHTLTKLVNSPSACLSVIATLQGLSPPEKCPFV
jgi:hypothetical protein